MMDIFNMLGGMTQTQQSIGHRLGTDPNQTASAVEAALPLLLGALTRNAAQPGGAAALEGALTRHDGSALDLFGQGQMPDTADGQKILGHIFGSQQTAAANAVGQRAGVNPQVAMQVLSMLAPLVLAYLSRQRQGQTGTMGGTNAGASAGGIDIGSILGSLLGGGMGGLGGLGGLLGGNAGHSVNTGNGMNTGGAGSVLGGGQVIPGLPSQNAGMGGQGMAPGTAGNAGSAGNLGGLMGTLNNVLDSNGNGNALDDLIGMFGGRRR